MKFLKLDLEISYQIKEVGDDEVVVSAGAGRTLLLPSAVLSPQRSEQQ